MRQIVAMAIVVGVVAGLAGGLTVAQLSGSAGASPPLQAREDQLMLWAVQGIQLSEGDFQTQEVSLLTLNPADYPPSSVFRFEVVYVGSSGNAACVRLFDRTDGQAVPGSDICFEGSGQMSLARSAPLSLPAADHVYLLQGRCTAGLSCHSSLSVPVGRVIVEWVERAR